jgi:hypothetical protein
LKKFKICQNYIQKSIFSKQQKSLSNGFEGRSNCYFCTSLPSLKNIKKYAFWLNPFSGTPSKKENLLFLLNFSIKIP